MMEKHTDEIFDLIADGESISKLAIHFNCGKKAIRSILEAHPARANAAYKTAADSATDEAERVLYDEGIDIMRAREIASHLRWKAKMFNRQKYGEKVDVTSDDKAIGNSVPNEVLVALADKINS